MTKQEFLDTLRRALNRELNEAEVEENIRYYDHYIREKTAGGQSEAQVLASLGDPRLIARTILQVDEKREEEYQNGYSNTDAVYTETSEGSGYYSQDADRDSSSGGGYGYNTYYGEDSPQDGRHSLHTVRLTGWKVALILITVLAVIALILGTAAVIFWKLLPALLVIWFVLWIYNRLFR